MQKPSFSHIVLYITCPLIASYRTCDNSIGNASCESQDMGVLVTEVGMWVPFKVICIWFAVEDKELSLVFLHNKQRRWVSGSFLMSSFQTRHTWRSWFHQSGKVMAFWHVKVTFIFNVSYGFIEICNNTDQMTHSTSQYVTWHTVSCA